MQITHKNITIKELVESYADNDENGVFAYGGNLNIRPPYQRNFCYDDKQQRSVIDTWFRKLPLNVMYWSDDGDNKYSIIDGQQRTLSICRYVAGMFTYKDRYFHNLTDDEKEDILSYEITVYICKGTSTEKLDWFRIINIAGARLTEQELRNATYSGSWLSDAKRYFSKTNCVAYQMASEYLTGVPIRQDYLETVLKWISHNNIEEYMAKHQHDPTAEELWLYFDNVIHWVKQIFIKYRKEMKGIDWGLLYEQNNQRKDIYPNEVESKITRLMADSDVTNKKGIYYYILDGNVNHLNVRKFDDNTKETVYERQHGKCPRCIAEGNDKTYLITEMDADHITPFVEGGHTVIDNCQLLCKRHNRSKGCM